MPFIYKKFLIHFFKNIPPYQQAEFFIGIHYKTKLVDAGAFVA